MVRDKVKIISLVALCGICILLLVRMLVVHNDISKEFSEISKTTVEMGRFARAFQKIKVASSGADFSQDDHKGLKECVVDILKNVGLNKAKVKTNTSHINNHTEDTIEISIDLEDEQIIYVLLSQLFFNLNGIVQVKTIDIKRNNDALSVHLMINVYGFTRNNVLSSVQLRPIDRPKEKFYLFSGVPRHKLKCTVDNDRAYIDNNWYSVGDVVANDFELRNINNQSIEIIDGDKNIVVPIGSEW